MFNKQPSIEGLTEYYDLYEIDFLDFVELFIKLNEGEFKK